MSVVRPEALWFGTPAEPLMGLLHLPPYAARAGVLLCPPLGYEAWTSHQTYRRIAEELSQFGLVALRFDYAGTGDSSGDYAEPARVAAYLESVRQGAHVLRAHTSGPLLLIGLRFGALLAALLADELCAAGVALWDPIASGKRYVRELKMMSASSRVDTSLDDGCLEIAGCVHTPETLADLSKLEIAQADLRKVKQVLIVERQERSAAAALPASLEAAGVPFRVCAVRGTSEMMDESTEESRVPENIVALLRDFCVDLTRDEPPAALHRVAPSAASAACFDWRGARVREEAVRIGPIGLFGVLGTPPVPSKTIAIFLSSGTEHRVGPGRTWVEYGRGFNAHGIATLRVDFDGVGDSPLRGPTRRVRPYDPAFFEDVADVMHYARSLGYARIAVLGLCSGAWMAVRAGLELGADIVAPINVQMYWEAGDHVESSMRNTIHYYAEQRAREARLSGYGLWTGLDVLRARPQAGRWLDGLVNNGVRTLLAFSDRDPGLHYLEQRCARRLRRVVRSGLVKIVEVSGLDHPMHRHLLRPPMFDALLRHVEAA
jgi:alpha/beta superfamily hydrolase